ncbi:uncharacterized protein LOC106163465 [Lingula anatina]|uniref:Uncharacterized protein LOC106163465 n=1 Tax=Lingula anatina TaxID=7574 RepID=A0A1S3IED3_LINAN|nr:uncharacterized protein LOC106163465 [Lingula anatina]|eukprot:XP_013396513.1 uncharacterized protein LOC106163465 [Lingula anatina]
MDLAEEPGHSDADQENPNQRPICDGQPFQLQESYKATARLTSRVIEQVEDLSGAMDLMEEMQVSMEGIETLDDALERLELHRKKMETGGRPNEGSQVFTHIKDIDDEGRSNLQAIFSDVIDHMAFLDHEGVIVERLRAEALLKGQSASEDLMMRRAALNSGECPILVAGETSSGKSSLLNVLLQDKVLPEDHLPCTATITRIKYAPPNEKRIVIRQVNDCAHTDDEMETVIPLKDAGVSIHDALKPYLFPEDRSKQLAYTVDIFLPLDVLKSGVYIVDTPGIGESEIMDRILTDFIDQNSVFAFIYVILSDNAGGVQEDRLQKLLKMLVEHQDADSANSFDPRSAIFVCNRWDLVPKEDRKMVKEKIIKDLDKCWPGISPEKQVFTMSAKKARVSMGLGYVSDDYDTLLNGIKELVPISLQRQILLSYNWLRRFVTRTMTTAEVYVSNASLSKEDLLKVHRQVEQKLQTFRDNADSKMEELTKDLEDNIEFTATCLKDHFYTTEVKQELTEWKLPDTQGGLLFEDFESIIEETINKKIMSIISSWEKKGNYMAAALESQFKKYATHFQLLESELKQIEDELIEKTNAYPMGNLQDITDEFHIDVEGLMDDDVARTPIMTLKEKVAIGLFAPVILPVGFVAGIFAAIPMALLGLSSIKKWIRRKRQDEVVHLYRADPTDFSDKTSKQDM